MSEAGTTGVVRRSALVSGMIAIAITQAASLSAQQAVSVVNVPPHSIQTGSNGKPLEIEIVDVGRLMTWPNTIVRPAGKFILLLQFHSNVSVSSLQIDPASIPDGTVGPNPILRLDTQVAHSNTRRLAYLVDLPAGEFHLKNGSSGAMLCAIAGK